MIRKILFLQAFLFFLFNPFIVNAESSTNIEIFDIEKSEVIKEIPTNSKIKLEVEKTINGADNVLKKLNPIPDRGYMIKVPFEPSLSLENQWLYARINEVIIIIPKVEKPTVPEDKNPYLLLFDDENMPHFITFKTKLDPLLSALDFSF